jgi:hypothetical protein
MATAFNLEIDQATDFETFISLADDDGSPLDITGFVFKGTMKKDYESANSISFTCQIEDAANGIFSFKLDDQVTYPAAGGRYVYDVICYDVSNTVIRLFEGIATLHPYVTNPEY